MTQATATLAEFLLARIAEDETAAKAASPGGRWQVQRRGIDGHAVVSLDEHAYELPDYPAVVMDDESGGIGPGVPTMRYIARWDPARVLAECQAKRTLVELHRDVDGKAHMCPGRGASDDEWVSFEAGERVVRTYPCPVILQLGLPYADHADYRQEWRP